MDALIGSKLTKDNMGKHTKKLLAEPAKEPGSAENYKRTLREMTY